MREQIQVTSTPNTPSQLPQHKSAPEAANMLVRPAELNTGKVRVVNGANEKYYENLVGRKVGVVRERLRGVFNISSDAQALINGNSVNEDYVLQQNDNLEFMKIAGTKGF